MNERIKELAQKTNLIDTIREHHNEFGSGDVDYSNLEKFAELIVGKCIAQCEQFLDDPDFTIGAMRCAIQLNQYFGVKE